MSKNKKLLLDLKQIGEISNENYIDILKYLFNVRKYHCQSIMKIQKLSNIITLNTSFLNIIPNCKLSTRIAYILKNKQTIAKCKICGKPILLNTTPHCNLPHYHNQCLINRANINLKIHNEKIKKQYINNYKKITIPEKENNIYYKNNSHFFNELINIIEHHPSYSQIILHSKKYLLNWINNQLLFLDQTIKYSISYKVYCILYNITKYPRCKHIKCQREMKSQKSFLSIYEGFRNFCSNSCAQSDESTQKTIQKTLFKHYGKHVKSAFQIKSVREAGIKTMKEKFGCTNANFSFEIKRKQRKRYTFKNIQFDSAPELALYIYLLDHNENFEYHPKISFSYIVNGKKHKYYPDFIIKNQLVEIKGLHFFKDYNKNNEMIFPFKYCKNKTSKEIEEFDQIMKAKQKCMKENNVLILCNDEYQKYLNYVYQKYGKKYISSFKNN